MTARRPRKITKDVAQILLNVRAFFEEEKANRQRIGVDRAVERAPAATGFCRAVVCRLTNEDDLESRSPGLSGLESRARPRCIPPRLAEEIRLAVIAIRKEEKGEPTVDGVLRRLRQSAEEGQIELNLQRASLYKVMRELNFTFSNRPSHYQKAREDPRIIKMRKSYLSEIRKHRAQGRDIFFQDETWIYKNMLRRKAWFREGIAADIPSPSGKGQRVIISHVGSKKGGLLPGALLSYRGANSAQSSDCHSEMNTEVFLDWLGKKVLPKIAELSDSATLVLDRASYRAKLTDFTRPPTTGMRKAALIKCIEKWDGPSDDWPLLWRSKKTNAEMLVEAKRIKPPARYLCQEMADPYGIGILLLPVAHPELNPIELLWAQIKDECAKGNQQMKLAELEKAAKQHFESFSVNDWEAFEEHAVGVESKYLDN